MKTGRSNLSRLVAYGLFDFGASAFTLIVHAYAFPVFFRTVLLADEPRADLWWGLLLSGSAIIGSTVAPLVGRYADRRDRYSMFRTLAWLSFLSTFAIAATLSRGPLVVAGVFVVASVLYFLSTNFYDSLLAVVAPKESRETFSGWAWGFGYLGGVVCFLFIYFLNGASISQGTTYITTGVVYSIAGGASLLLLRRFVPPNAVSEAVSFREMLDVLTRSRILLLAGYWLIADAIGAIIGFVGIYGVVDLGLSSTDVGLYLLGVQLAAFPLTYLVSLAAKSIGARRAINSCAGLWVLILVLLALGIPANMYWVVAALTATVIGSTQALMRAEYASVVAQSRASEIFGWYSVATKSMAVVLPVVFGAVSVASGSRALGMATLVVPMVLGAVLSSIGIRRVSGQI